MTTLSSPTHYLERGLGCPVQRGNLSDMWQFEIIRCISYFWTQPTFSLRSNMWWPPTTLCTPRPNPLQQYSTRETTTTLQTQRSGTLKKKKKKKKVSLRGWEEYKSTFYPTYLRDRTESFNADLKPLWKPYNTVSYTISREYQLTWVFLGEK